MSWLLTILSELSDHCTFCVLFLHGIPCDQCTKIHRELNEVNSKRNQKS